MKNKILEMEVKKTNTIFVKISRLWWAFCVYCLHLLTRHRKGNENPVELVEVELEGGEIKVVQPCPVIIKRCLFSAR